MQKIESQPCRWWVEIAPGSQPYLALEANNPAPKGYGGTGEVQAAQVFSLADDGHLSHFLSYTLSPFTTTSTARTKSK